MQDVRLNNGKINVTLRISLLSSFQDTIHKEMRVMNCSYFTHQLIQNYRQTGHTVSSFHTNPDWQREYWQDHWDCDPLERKIHKIAETEGFVISSWDFVDSGSDVMQRRKSLCQLDDGVQFTFKHDNGFLENFSFGWKKADTGQMDFQDFMKLSSLVNEFRDNHIKLSFEPTQDFFDEG